MNFNEIVRAVIIDSLRENDMPGFWDAVGSADFNDRGNYFTEGNYTVEIVSIKTKQGFRGHSLIFTFTVIESSVPDVTPGESRDWVLKLDGQNARMAFGDIKGFVYALFGVDQRDIAFGPTCGQVMDRAVGIDNPLAGMRILCEAFNIKVKVSANNPTGDFTKLRWHPYTATGQRTASEVLGARAAGTQPAPMPWQAPGGPGFSQGGGFVPPPPNGLPPPPPARPANLPPGHLLQDGRWWNGTSWVGP